MRTKNMADIKIIELFFCIQKTFSFASATLENKLVMSKINNNKKSLILLFEAEYMDEIIS
jgi:hypothetical protein